MLQREWTERTKNTPEPTDWEIISLVYTWHPSIPDVGGKDHIAKLFALGGMALIRDMLPRAEKMLDFDTRLSELKQTQVSLRLEKETAIMEYQRREISLVSEIFAIQKDMCAG